MRWLRFRRIKPASLGCMDMDLMGRTAGRVGRHALLCPVSVLAHGRVGCMNLNAGTRTHHRPRWRGSTDATSPYGLKIREIHSCCLYDFNFKSPLARDMERTVLVHEHEHDCPRGPGELCERPRTRSHTPTASYCTGRFPRHCPLFSVLFRWVSVQ